MFRMTKQNIVSADIIRELNEENRRRNITDGSKIKNLGFIRAGTLQLDLHNQSYILWPSKIFTADHDR